MLSPPLHMAIIVVTLRLLLIFRSYDFHARYIVSLLRVQRACVCVRSAVRV